MTKLKHLTLGPVDNEFADADVRRIGQLPNLEHLGLMGCKVTDEDLAELGNLNRLKYLDLNLNGRITDAGLVHIGKLTNLQHLDLYYEDTQFSDEGLTHLGQLRNLEYLSLCARGRNITDAALILLLTQWSKLRHLDLANFHQITDESVAQIAQLSNLKELCLNGCNLITNVGLQKLLSQLSNLCELDLRDCDLIAENVERISRPGLVVNSWDHV